MARREATERNELRMHDNLSDTDILFYYRTPTTSEIEAYNNLAIQRKGKKVKFKQAEARLKYGLRILTGVREGDFERKVGDEYVPIASDKSSANFYPEWKSWLRANAADLVMLLGLQVFDVSGEINDPDDELDDELDADAGEDVTKNSTETLPQ